MKKEVISRLGENIINKWGDEVTIIKYNSYGDILVEFKKYKEIIKTTYCNFKKGTIKSKFTKSIFNVGYIGVGKYKIWEGNSQTIEYIYWMSMLSRCYYDQNKRPTYTECTVCEEWLNFQNFADWFENNYYTIDDEKMCLDKDILAKGNKIYSPQTCCFVSDRINKLFTKSDAKRGDLPIRVDCSYNKYRSRCSVYKNGKKSSVYLGLYNSKIEAFNVYKEFKEKYIKEVADEYKDKIPLKLYDTLCNYIVEITD